MFWNFWSSYFDRIEFFFSDEKIKNSIIFEATKKMKKYVLIAMPKPRARKTEVDKFEKVE
jgi:hypothetical protein